MRQTILLILIIAPTFLTAEEFSARVIRVKDGDTIAVVRNGHTLWLRLNGIDCPEQGQAKAEVTSKFVNDVCAGKIVKVSTYRKDRYGRMIADIFLDNGESLTQRLLRAGYCHRDRNYASKQK